MARSAILGNGGLAVGIDENGLVHDFYYPYVGLENLNSARISNHKIGVWVDGEFSWLDNGDWNNSIDMDEFMIVNSIHINTRLGIKLSLKSFVDHEFDAFIRSVSVENMSVADKKEVRVFFHQVFQISSGGRADTALYSPDGHYILDYKGRCCLLIKGKTESGSDFDQYAVGNFGMEGKEGTYKDAEDGELSMSNVEHAGVDSVIRFKVDIEPKSTKLINYWVIAADSQYEARKINLSVIDKIPERITKQEVYFRNWLSPAKNQIDKLEEKHKKILIYSLLTIKAHTDKRGGVIASCDSSIYNYGRDYYSYVWPRDGAFALWPLIRLGMFEEAKQFFLFCADIMSPYGYMLHKYQPDKAIGSTWHPLLHNNHAELAIQEDETALIIFMIGEYLDYSDDLDFVKSLYAKMIQPMANFMTKFIDEQTNLPHASYDLWEQKFLTTTFSTAATYKSLVVASKIANKLNHKEDSELWAKTAINIKKQVNAFYDIDRQSFRKGFLLSEENSLKFDNTLDISSFYASFTFDFVSSKDQILNTAKRIEDELLDISPSGGVCRYEYDDYFKNENNPYKGNPWIITTLWMSQYYNRVKETDKSIKYLNWAIEKSSKSGALSEQVNTVNSSSVGVTPLVWSHAELVNTILDIYQ